MRIIKKWKTDENGHTIIEMMVALAIFLSVVVPTASFFRKVMMKRDNLMLNTAVQIAREELEQSAAFQFFDADERVIREHDWTIRKEIDRQSGLVRISVSIIENKRKTTMVKLETLRYAH